MLLGASCNQMVQSFRHAGDIGDIIYSLPSVKYLGGGDLYIEAAEYTRQRLTPDKWACLTKLLLSQPYIKDVKEFAGGRATYNLNDFRATMSKELRQKRFAIRTSLAQRMAEQHGVPLKVLNEPWLSVPGLVGVADVVFSRSTRYAGNNFPWTKAVEQYGKRAVFVGLSGEHKEFIKNFGYVPWYPTEDLMAVAQVIAGAMLFVGNQSAPFAIAEALKQNAVLEVWHEGPNCLFARSNVWHFWNADPALPDLDSLIRCVDAPTAEFDEQYFARHPTNPERELARATALVRHLGIKPSERLLDFGCGTGVLVQQLRNQGIKAFGMDGSVWAREHCADVKEFLLEPAPSLKEYDWVTALCVLEYLPSGTLEAICRRLLAAARRGLCFVVPLCEVNGGRYLFEEDNTDDRKVVRWSLATWMRFLSELDTDFTVQASLHLPEIDPAISRPGGRAFFTVTRISQ